MIEGLKTTLDRPFKEIKSQIILGSEGFIDKLKRYLDREAKIREMPALRTLKKTLTIEDVITEIKKHFKIKRESLISKSGRVMRQIAMEMAYRYTNSNQEEIGKVFGVDYSTVSQNRKSLKLKLEKELKGREILSFAFFILQFAIYNIVLCLLKYYPARPHLQYEKK
jgi:hypothetical protein